MNLVTSLFNTDIYFSYNISTFKISLIIYLRYVKNFIFTNVTKSISTYWTKILRFPYYFPILIS